MVRLTSENLSNLGGSMGTEYTYDNWVKYFTTVAKAKAYAEKDYRKGEIGFRGDPLPAIRWTGRDRTWSSGDLRWVMYHIATVKVVG